MVHTETGHWGTMTRDLLEMVKQVPGCKSDVRDCQWIAQLLQCGLLQGSLHSHVRSARCEMTSGSVTRGQ
jgi:hypothetical protein